MPTRRHHHELRDAAPQRAAHRTRASPATGRTADARTAAPTVTLAPTGRTTRRAPWRAASGAVLGRTPSARSAAAPAHAGAYGDPGPRCGRYVPISRPTGGRSRQALPQPDLPRPGNGKEFQPSRRLSETTRQRFVSTFRVAFRSVEITEWRAPGKRATARFTLRAPRCSLSPATGAPRPMIAASPRVRLHLLPRRITSRPKRRRSGR